MIINKHQALTLMPRNAAGMPNIYVRVIAREYYYQYQPPGQAVNMPGHRSARRMHARQCLLILDIFRSRSLIFL